MIPKVFTRRPGVFVLVLVAGVILATFGSLHAPFIAHKSSILHLPLLAWWRNLPLIFSRDFLMFTQGQFRPLSYGLLAVVRTFIGPDKVLFWHGWLIAFHWLNAILVFALVRHFSRHLGSAMLAAVVFSLHPLASVVVNNINHFHYVLGLTFYLGALCCYLSFVPASRRGCYIAAVGLFALGLFTSKVVFTLPIVLGAYEVVYRRLGLRTTLVRLLPFVALPLILSPFWLFYKPHPLYYKYIEFPSGAGWYSFFSAVGATGWYLKGLLLGWDIPVVLHEAIGRIFKFTHWRFLVWGAFGLGGLVAGGWALGRRRWAGLGVMLLFGAMIPFASTTWNGVEDYVSWAYLYVPLAGLALLVGGLADALWPSGWPSLSIRIGRRIIDRHAGMLTVLCLVVLYYGVQQARINVASRSAAGYWRYVLRLNPSSETASVELGKAFLDQGEAGQALHLLFSPAVKRIQGSCLAMSRYYCARGDYLAAAVHLRMVGQQKAGIQFQDYETAAAGLFYATGAPDYAEASLGSALMANPYNIAAMEQLAEVWLSKGYVAAAGRLIGRALEIAPSHPRAGRMQAMLEAHRSVLATLKALQVVHPPAPDWLRYVFQGVSDPRLRGEIVRLSERHRSDPVIQMEAGICLVRDGQPDRALSKLESASQVLSSYAYVWAIKCWAAVEAGAYSEAEEAGRRALELDPQSPTVHHVLGILFSTLAGDPRDPTYQGNLDQAIRHYQRAIQFNPRHAAAHNRLGTLLVRQGRLEEAITYYRQALRLEPDYAQAHYNLGVILLKQGNLEEAITHFQQALRVNPDYAQAHNNLGAALLQQGNLGEAIAHFRQALRINPDYATARDNLCVALVGHRRFSEAIHLLRERVARVPDDLDAVLNLAWLLATCPEPGLRNGTEAVRLAERVCRARRYKYPRALDVLAAAYAEIGRFDKAVQKAQQALQLAASSGQAKLGRQITARLKLYKAHRPVP